ncbi:carbohydrate porin [Vibrio maritimus]|nr:carbohydrate porin [Vibrio sp. SCSIO 43140]USD59669.1 carbohydrate porin [Vibrio sp. SCSIO 43140]
MEKTALSKALFIAGVAAISSMPALAEKPTSDFEFHGYFRAGAFTSAKENFKQHRWGGQKETLGRLGLEADDFWELAFMQRWDWEKTEDSDGKSVRINARLGQDNPNGNGSNGYANIDGKATGLIESFVEFDGVTNTGTLWGGQRYYGRDNYIFMTDFFYTDYSGTGIGVKGTELGGGLWDFAYIASNNSVGDNEMLNAFHVRADYGQWRIEGMAKQMGENVNGDEFAKSGFEGHVQYSPSNFFGFGNGFSKVGVQYGQGLGGSTMLGRTFTNYNAYSPGGVGFIDGSTEQTLMSAVKDGDRTVRAQAYGGYIGENWLFFPAVGYEQTSYEDNVDDFSYWYAMVRPVYTMPSIDDFAIAAEFGYTDNSANRDNGGNATYKATIAPTWTVGTGFGPAPEIRLLATYLKGNPGVSSNAGEDDHDFIVGVQVDMWW